MIPLKYGTFLGVMPHLCLLNIALKLGLTLRRSLGKQHIVAQAGHSSTLRALGHIRQPRIPPLFRKEVSQSTGALGSTPNGFRGLSSTCFRKNNPVIGYDSPFSVS